MKKRYQIDLEQAVCLSHKQAAPALSPSSSGPGPTWSFV